MRLYESYRKNKQFLLRGGQLDPAVEAELDPAGIAGVEKIARPDISPGVGVAATIGAGIIDATSKPDPTTGRQSTGATVAKGALSGAAAGATLGPAGALVGGAVGLIGGLFGARKQKRDAMEALNSEVDAKNALVENRSAAMLATNPSLAEGYRRASYFSLGGDMDPGRKVARTQAEVDAANAMAKRLSLKNRLVPGEDAYAVKKIGDTLPKFVGQGITMKKVLPTTIPAHIQASDIQNSGDAFWYTDPRTGYQVDVDPSVVNTPRLRTSTAAAVTTRVPINTTASLANGGYMDAPLARMKASGGKIKSLSSDNTELVGRSHEQGGIHIPGAELEDNETTKDNFVFSDKLGFADIHKKLAKAKGIIEKKPVTHERVTAMRLLSDKENKLAEAQELLKLQRHA